MRAKTGMGCERCFGEDALTAWSLEREHTDLLVDESHFAITIEACPFCGQQFVWIFTEFVDWEDGDDKQYWDVLPVTDEEAAIVREQGAKLDLHYLMALGAERRHLKADDHGIRWTGGGLFIMPGG